MWWKAFMITSCFGFLLNSCHGQRTLDDIITAAYDAASRDCQEQMITSIENLNENLEEPHQHLIEMMLEEEKFKFLPKIEAVRKEMRDRGSTIENTLREGLANVEKNLTKIQSQMLQMKDELMQRFGEFVDHFGNQSEATAERLSEDWTNFRRNLLSEVLDLHRPTINASSNVNLNTTVQGCHDLSKEGVKKNGVYQLHLEGHNSPSFSAYCDMTEGGGWTVIMRRADYGDNRTNFFRNWNHYRNGFGNLEQEFWLGNEKIHVLTSTGEFQLRVTLKAFDADVLRINYDDFTVESEEKNYRLVIAGADLPKEGEALQKHNGVPFSTWDRANDRSNGDCAILYQAGWWFDKCYNVLLTGTYFIEGEEQRRITWDTWKGKTNVKGAEMKIRPKNFR